MIYVSHCSHCGTEDRVHMMVFYKSKPFCWKCRCKLIPLWAMEQTKDNCDYM